jgi:hypothetical protein
MTGKRARVVADAFFLGTAVRYLPTLKTDR